LQKGKNLCKILNCKEEATMKNKTFMRVFLLFIMIVAVSLIGFSKEEAFESSWAASLLKIDGISKEWSTDSFGFEKRVKVDYAFMNNDESLYVLFIFKDRKYLSTIRHTGFTIWLNTEGKKKKIYGIKFRERKVSADELIAAIEIKEGPRSEAEKQQIKANPFYFIYQGEVIDKKGKVLIESSFAGGKNVPGFRSKPQKEGIVHEFKVPLKVLEQLSADQVLELGKTLKVGFEWGGLTKELKDAKAKQQAASGVKASGSAADVAITEDVRDGSKRALTSMASMRRGAEKHLFWVDVKLAQK